jgi:tetratricopeptide (TPR) repeat protein
VKLAATVVLVWCFGIARADADDSNAEAKTYFDQGTQHYDVREYAAAIAAFRKAYALMPDPLLLFDMAQSYRQLKDCDNARSFYRSFLRNKPDADNRAKVERFITEMDECVRAASAPPARVTTTSESTPPTSVTLGSERHPRLRLAGLVTGGTGVAIAASGIYFSFEAARHAQQVQDLCQHGCRAADVGALDRDGRTASRNAVLLYSIGGAAVAGGIAAFVYAVTHEHGVTVTPGALGASVTATVRF